jgi:hypothetical protein
LLGVVVQLASFAEAKERYIKPVPGALTDTFQEATAGDVLILEAGKYDITRATGLIIYKSLQIRGAMYNINGIDRSKVGKGDTAYAGKLDNKETSLVGSTKSQYVLKIQKSNTVIDGLTITSSYTGSSEHAGVIVFNPSEAITNVQIRNCVIRHLASNAFTNRLRGIYIHGTKKIENVKLQFNEIRDIKSTQYTFAIQIGGKAEYKILNQVIEGNKIENIHCEQDAKGIDLEYHEDTLVRGNVIVGIDTAVFLAHNVDGAKNDVTKITGNLVKNCKKGFWINDLAEVTKNVLMKNVKAIDIGNVGESYKTTVNNNDIYDNSEFDIINEHASA